MLRRYPSTSPVNLVLPPVHVLLHVPGEVIVEHVGHVVDVDSATRHVWLMSTGNQPINHCAFFMKHGELLNQRDSDMQMI